MNDSTIETRQLSYAFRKSSGKTLSNVNLQVPKNSIYCFLGPNGAGKTTTLRLLLGLLRVQEGEVLVFGKSLRDDRLSILRRVGSLIEQPSLYLHLTARQNLEISRLTYQCDQRRINEVLVIVDLLHARDQRVGTYSLGMKQRLSIALALLHDPDALILDEPTNGLDPQGIADIRILITRLQKDHNKTIVVSSHLLSEVEKIATHFGVINKGIIQFQGSKETLHKLRSDTSKLELEIDNSEKAMTILKEKFDTIPQGDSVLHVKGVDRNQVPEITRKLIDAEVGIYGIGFKQDNLEETFFNLVS